MPQIFKIGGYLVYFWANESVPIEPIHVHVTQGKPNQNATKIWITKTGKSLLANNNSNIPQHQLRIIMEIISSRHLEVENKWKRFFGEISYYC